MDLSKVLTIQGYAERKGITRQTVYNWIKEKKIETIKLGNQQFVKV